ncbi:homoserine dehydrogenase, partial [Kocuria oceani]
MSDSTPATPRPTTTVKVALLGAGNVGAEVARILLDHGTEMAARVGAPLELAGIAVRDL